MTKQKLLHIAIVSDYSAVGHYRLLFPEMRMRTVSKNMMFVESSLFIGDPGIYSIARTVKIQRPCSPKQFEFLHNFLKPMSERYGFWIIMDVDDCLVYEDIPKYNIAREFFKDVSPMLKKAMECVDFITTTTEYLKNYYVKTFDIQKDKFIVIPNYLPRWWIGNSFDINKTIYNHDTSIKNGKFKIGFICGGNHFDLKNVNGGEDDFTHLVEWVKDTIDQYEFHFVGAVPQQLVDELKCGKIFVDNSVDILNYPSEISNRNYNAWVCPLKDNVFNRCKSNIKLIEAWAMGIPVFVQKCECYNNFTSDVFETADELDNKIVEIIRNKKLMIDKVISGRGVIDNGDVNSNTGWWLENNMYKHNKIYSIPQRTMMLDMNDVVLEKKGNGGQDVC